MSLGNRILELRKKNGLSQEKLGEKINVTRQTISNWELGETYPNPEQLKLLSKTLNVSVDELLDNDVKNVLVEKVSNTEALAGIIIKILKVLGILLLVYITFIIVSIVVFVTIRKSTTITNDYTEVLMNCVKENSTYDIVFDTKGNYNCKSCSDEMNNDIKDIINFDDIDTSVRNIENYFENISGTCE